MRTRLARKGKGKHARAEQPAIMVQTAHGELVLNASPVANPEAVVPIGFVRGATPPPGTPIALPQVDDDKSAAAVMETRGRRRAKDDIAAGFDDLSTAHDQAETR